MVNSRVFTAVTALLLLSNLASAQDGPGPEFIVLPVVFGILFIVFTAVSFSLTCYCMWRQRRARMMGVSTGLFPTTPGSGGLTTIVTAQQQAPVILPPPTHPYPEPTPVKGGDPNLTDFTFN